MSEKDDADEQTVEILLSLRRSRWPIDLLAADLIERLQCDRDDLAKANADYKANWLEIKRERDEAEQRIEELQIMVHGLEGERDKALNVVGSSAENLRRTCAALTSARAEAARLREMLADLVSWFDGEPTKSGLWLIEAGTHGADDAVNAARAALAAKEPGHD
jgi:chromosome segregation ATPase